MNRTALLMAAALSPLLFAQNPKEDTTPPVIHQVEFREPLEAGKEGRFFFRATDSGSGIPDFKGNCSSLVPKNGGPDVSLCGAIKNEGGDWYSMAVKPGQFAMNDRYELKSFALSDRAGNYAEWKGSVHTAVINNGKQDKTPPELHEMKLDGKLAPGKKAKFMFRASDDVSGITTFKGGCSSLVPKDGGPSISICGKITKEPGDWYSIEVDVGEFAVGGEYTLSEFSISDEAGNSLHKILNEPFKVSVERNPSGDQKGPWIDDAWVNLGKCDDKGVRTAKFLFKAGDDKSGVFDFKSGCDSFHWTGGDAPSVSVCGKVEKHKKDWYSIEFPIPATAPHSRYTMKSFTIHDKAGNASTPFNGPVTFVNLSCEVDVTDRNAVEGKRSH